MKEREKIRYRLSVNHLSFAWLMHQMIDDLARAFTEVNNDE